MKIAVCDDEANFTETICSLLEQWGKERGVKLTLYRFTNGDDLIDAHQSECMDLIILDVIMPLLSGIDTARELRNTHQAACHFAGNFFTARTADGFCRIMIADVNYLEAQNKQVLVHLSNDKMIAIRELFSECVEVFSPENGFCRCHRSYIVNLNNVERFSKTEIITNYGAVIPISRNSYTAFKETYFNHMFGGGRSIRDK